MATLSIVVFLNTTTRVSLDHNSHTFCSFLFLCYETVPFCCLWGVVAPFSFAVFANAYAFNGDVSTWNTGAVTNMNSLFYQAYSFNKDVSNWNTGAVTDMGYSKCILSLPLGGHAFHCRVFEYTTTQFSHILLFMLCYGGTLSCSVLLFLH